VSIREVATMSSQAVFHFGAHAVQDPFARLAGESRVVATLREALRRIARADATVLLRGETGTGKGLAARLLHDASPRAGAPFVHVDCAALAPSVIESELFGHERGAFTGADACRPGRLEAAARGTLFLDEIAELEPRLQAKLLRALQDRVFERVGGPRTLALGARVVAATHRDLRSAVASGAFRADLYFRLQVCEVTLPPLRERLEDLPLLARRGLEKIAARAGRATPRPTGAFLEVLARHPWPGTVRELENLLERVVVHDEDGVLDGADAEAGLDSELMALLQAPPPPDVPAERRDHDDADDRARVAAALVAVGGNVARAARRLGVARTTLRHRVDRYGLRGLIPRD
jgi:transcriptional regulator with GAF, ATPase, and Fis domain